MQAPRSARTVSTTRMAWRACVLLGVTGFAVLLFTSTASAESCEARCDNASDAGSPRLLGAALHGVDGLVQQPVDVLVRRGTPQAPGTAEAVDTSSAATPEPIRAPAQQVETPETTVADPVAEQAEQLTATATQQLATGAAELVDRGPLTPVTEQVSAAGEQVTTVMEATGDLSEAVTSQALAIPVANTLQRAQSAGESLAGSLASTLPLLTSQTLLDDTTEAVAPLLTSVTGLLGGVVATALGGPARHDATTAPSAGSPAPGLSGGAELPIAGVDGVSSPDALPLSGQQFLPPTYDLVDLATTPASPPPQVDDPGTALLDTVPALPSSLAPAAPAASGSAAPGGSSSPSAADVGSRTGPEPAARQTGFAPARRPDAHVPSAPVAEPAQSPD